MEPSPMPRRDLILLLLSLVLGLVACATRLRATSDAPPQGWWKERGPVVPHDTFPEDCSLCHAGDDWHTIRDDFAFDHLARTGVELVGAHTDAECLRCHNDKGPVAVFANRGCAGCHEDVHQGQLGQDCELCHTQVDWGPGVDVEMHNRTRFPLVGSHVAVACWRCHPGSAVGNFTAVDTECASCHRDDLARATDPDHQALGFTDDCQRCHIPTTWTGPGFNHAIFPLTGAHALVDCSECHVGGVFAGTPTDCYACHMDDYAGALDPDHAAGGFSTSCEQCHDTSTWDDAFFDHSTFPLTGAHAPLDCSACHVGGVFTGTPTDCYACHMDDFAGTTDPDHAAGGFPTSCEQCHDTTDWDDALFSHTGITTGCDDCHLTDFLATTDPDHQAAGFPVSCETCHNTLTWLGAVFDHDFPIDRGDHRNLDCSECHVVPTDFASFECILCHEHRQSEADDEHKDVSGYVWESSACYACHPNGN